MFESLGLWVVAFSFECLCCVIFACFCLDFGGCVMVEEVLFFNFMFVAVSLLYCGFDVGWLSLFLVCLVVVCLYFLFDCLFSCLHCRFGWFLVCLIVLVGFAC